MKGPFALCKKKLRITPEALRLSASMARKLPHLGKLNAATRAVPVLPQSPSSPGQSLSRRSSGPLHVLRNHSHHMREEPMLGDPPLTMEWQDIGNSNPLWS